jgi:hypothetical protein
MSEHSGVPLPALAAVFAESHGILKKIYSTPAIEKELVSSLNRAIGRELFDPADCDVGFGVAIVVVAIAAPKMPDPTERLKQQIQL